MLTFSGQVSQSSDDATQPSSGSNFLTVAQGTFGTAFANFLYAGFRFQSVTLPPNATIVSATLSLYLSSTTAVNGTGSLDCVLSTNASTFTSVFETLQNLTLTGNTTTWNFVNPSAIGFFATADFSPAVQAVVNQGGWVSGNSLAVLLSNPQASISFQMNFYDQGAMYGALLNVSYLSPFVPTKAVMLNGLPLFQNGKVVVA